MNAEQKQMILSQTEAGIIDTLNDQSNEKLESEWTLRLKALQQIQEFLVKEDTTLTGFLENYKSITNQLLIQLKDLRSAIVKEAIKILNIAASKFRANFDTFACKFIDTLFILVSSTTNAISKSAIEGIKTILENVYSSKVFVKLLENSKHKSLQVKLVCCEAIFFCLKTFPKSILDNLDTEVLLLTMKSFVCDSGKVRDLGKECFMAFGDKYPEKADRLIQLVYPVSKKISEELKSLKKTFDIDSVTDFPANVEISEEEWAIFDKLNIYEAVRLAVTQTSFQGPEEIQIESILEKASNQSWNVREKSFIKIHELLKSSSKISDLEAIVRKIVDHVKDSHVKVVRACMECLVLIAEEHSILLTSYFPDLLQLVLEISLSKKEDLSENANLVLERLLEKYPPDDLLIYFLSISSTKSAVKVVLIEIIQYLIEISESFCFSHHNMSILCKKLSSMTVDGTKSTIISVIKALEKACDKNVFGTLQGVLELPYEEQSTFKKYCQDYSSLLDEMLKGYSKSLIPNSIDVIEEVEEEDLTGSILEPSEQYEDYHNKSTEDIISNLQHYLCKYELKFESLQAVIIELSKQLNEEHNEESKRSLRNLSMIAKYYKSDKVGVELLSVLSKMLSWENSNLQHDLDSVIKGVIEKMNTGSAVMGILESLKRLESPALQSMLEYLIQVIKERSNIGFFGKEIGVRLKDVLAHPHAEVRKNVVLVLAELLNKVEPGPFLAIFNQGQQKLIEIYRQKLASADLT